MGHAGCCRVTTAVKEISGNSLRVNGIIALLRLNPIVFFLQAVQVLPQVPVAWRWGRAGSGRGAGCCPGGASWLCGLGVGSRCWAGTGGSGGFLFKNSRPRPVLSGF